MPDIFNKPPTDWDSMDLIEFDMLANNHSDIPKSKPGCSSYGCLTSIIVAIGIAVLIIWL